eukprot:scaffold51218_cov42-Phaeocystis_antarctica.AAC.1
MSAVLALSSSGVPGARPSCAGDCSRAHSMATLSLLARSASEIPPAAGASTPSDHSWKRGSYRATSSAPPGLKPRNLRKSSRQLGSRTRALTMCSCTSSSHSRVGRKRE